MRTLDSKQKHPARGGGTIQIVGPRDRMNRCQFVIEWQDKVAHCSKCGLRVGEGYPIACGDGPTCTALKRTPSGQVVCGGAMTKDRGQVFFARPEDYAER